ncbi:hypothetical protein JW906_04745 [bacterium]|nr:hypothetical protein [bacterium]
MSDTFFLIQADDSGFAEFTVHIPLANRESSDKKDKWEVKVFQDNRELPVSQEGEEFVVHHRDRKGIHHWKVCLFKNGQQTQEMPIRIKIEKTVDASAQEEPAIGKIPEDIERNVTQKMNDIKCTDYGMDERIFEKERIEIMGTHDPKTVEAILLKILSNPDENIFLVWKAVEMLKRARNTEALPLTKKWLIKTTNSSSADQNFQVAILNYYDFINNINTWETIKELLFYVLTNCPVQNTRLNAFQKLLGRISLRDEYDINRIVEQIDKETYSAARRDAILRLERFDLQPFREDLAKWMQDFDVGVRGAGIEIAFRKPNLVDFSLVQQLFEFESSYELQKKLGWILIKLDKKSAVDYLIKYFDFGNEKLLQQIVTLFQQEKISDAVEKAAAMLNNGMVSPEYKRSFEAYINSFPKKPA